MDFVFDGAFDDGNVYDLSYSMLLGAQINQPKFNSTGAWQVSLRALELAKLMRTWYCMLFFVSALCRHHRHCPTVSTPSAAAANEHDMIMPMHDCNDFTCFAGVRALGAGWSHLAQGWRSVPSRRHRISCTQLSFFAFFLFAFFLCVLCFLILVLLVPRSHVLPGRVRPAIQAVPDPSGLNGASSGRLRCENSSDNWRCGHRW